MRGYVHVYTGNGKGKTTAAMGLALRAAGAGLRVFIGQFLKARHTSEMESLARLSDRVTFRQYGMTQWVIGSPRPDHTSAAQDGLRAMSEAITSGEYDLVVLDEANMAVALGLLDVDELLELIDRRPPHTELVLTGRNVDPRIVARADLVTEMREVKHYYRQGVLARVGIEY